MQYLGSIVGIDLLQKLSPFMNIDNPGGTIILEIKPIDYTMTQIASIVESNDAHIWLPLFMLIQIKICYMFF